MYGLASMLSTVLLSMTPTEGSGTLKTGTALTVAAGPVQMEVIPQFERVDLRQMPQAINLLMRLRGQASPKKARPPLDLAVVLDRSGSMNGDKIAAVKSAAQKLLTGLGPDDRITVISYSNDVVVHTRRVDTDAAGISLAHGEIGTLVSGGGTALGPGLFRGLELLELARRAPREQAHVLLLSDGIASDGETRPEVLAARAGQGFGMGVSVSTLGVGVDYNEDLMTKIADHGGGRYHFIESPDDVQRVIAEELAGLASTTATGIRLDLRTAPDVRVTRVFGYAAHEGEGKTQLSVGSIGAGQVRDIVVRLSVVSGSGDRIPLGVLGLTATDLTGGRQHRAELALALRTSRDDAEIQGSERAETTARVIAVETADEIDRSGRAAESGNHREAIELLLALRTRLKARHAAAPDPALEHLIAEVTQVMLDVEEARNRRESKGISKKLKSKAYKTFKK